MMHSLPQTSAPRLSRQRWRHLSAFAWAVVFSAALTGAAQMTTAGHEFMVQMHKSMSGMDHDMESACMTGDADHDFAAMMIPHHRGAMDMAKAELQYGKNPVMRRLAQEILVDQQSEIDAMVLWLNKKQTSEGHNKCVSH